MIKDYGFSHDLVTIDPEDYHFGSKQLAGEVLQPNGDWIEYLPVYEPQAKDYETSGCTAFGALNQIETLFKRLYNFEPNYSDRYTYINADVTLSGRNPKYVYDSIRHQGVVDEEVLPRPDTYREFVTPKPMEKAYLTLGEKWTEKYSLGYDWVLTGFPDDEKLFEALKYCPLGVSVTAWMTDKDGLYIDNNMPNTHWCVLVKMIKRIDGKYRKFVFDSYKKEIKELHPDHKIYFAMRATVDKVIHKKFSWKRFFKSIIEWIWPN